MDDNRSAMLAAAGAAQHNLDGQDDAVAGV